MLKETFVEVPWQPIVAPVRSSSAQRSPAAYVDVIAQFEVELNPRYRPREGKTYCNIFAWDVTSAMDAEIPHWTTPDGRAAGPGQPGAVRMNCNAMHDWLRVHGGRNGWKRAAFQDLRKLTANG